MHPTVSVIMAAYNVENYISASIESILKQTFRDFELIIINDGSTDSTLSIIENYQGTDSRIKVINNKENQFVIKSRNTGIKSALGKYISIMDSDDIALPEKLDKQTQFLENNPDVFLLGSSASLIDEKNNPIKDYLATIDYNEIKKEIVKNNTFYHSSIMFRNSGILFREKMMFSEDYDLLLFLLSENKVITNLPDKLIQYRVIPTSLSHKSNKLIQWLFKNQTLQFYYQRISTGTDSYDSFNPEELLQIENPDYPANKENLLLAMKGCFYEKNRRLLKMLSLKYKRYHPTNKYSFFYSFISKNDFIFHLSHKLYSNL